MSTVRVDSRYRILLDKRVREIMGIKKGEAVVIVPFRTGAVLIALGSRSFSESLRGFKYVEAEHEASRYLRKGMGSRAGP